MRIKMKDFANFQTEPRSYGDEDSRGGLLD